MLRQGSQVAWPQEDKLALHPSPGSSQVSAVVGSRSRGTVVLRARVGIGAAGSPTPIGRFGITDELRGLDPAVYGCCVLALSGHQTHLPPGWTGGDRLAIHGGGGIGAAVSSGCLHASETTLRRLMRAIPLGTQVVIHP